MLKRINIFVFIIMMALACALNAHGFNLTIAHVNDTHSHLEANPDSLILGGEKTYVQVGGWPLLKTKIERLRADNENLLVLHGGDAVQGTLYFTTYKGRVEMELMNLLGFDAMVLGNHEFDNGPVFLADFLRYTDIPVLSANAEMEKNKALESRVLPYVIIDFHGEKIGIIGLTTRETMLNSSPGPVGFADEAAMAKQLIGELKSRSITKIIALTHMGYEEDIALAGSLAGIDVVVGGHSHSLLDNQDNLKKTGKYSEGAYPTVVRDREGNQVCVVTAWEKTKAVGVLDVVFDGRGQVQSCSGTPVLLLADSFKRKNKEGRTVELQGEQRRTVLDTVRDNPALELTQGDRAAHDLLAPYRAGLEGVANQSVGEAAQLLLHLRLPGVHSSGKVMADGSDIAPLVAAAMLGRVNGVGLKVDLALQNAGGVRRDLNQGRITVGDIHTLLPFSNTLVVMELSGRTLRAVLEHGLSRGGGAFLYASGGRYIVDMQQPQGQRISRLEFYKENKWVEMEETTTYRVVTNSYLAGGGDGYQLLRQSEGYRYDTGFVDTQVFTDYVREQKTLRRPDATGVILVNNP